MKIRTLVFAFCCSLFALALSLNAEAQEYSVAWIKIAGGGGVMTNAQFCVNATVAQHDVTTQQMSGGEFSVAAGSWSSITVLQTRGAPLLSISAAGGNVVVSWPSPSTGYVLEQTTALGTPNWTSVTNLISDNGTNKSINVSAGTGVKFYRLKKCPARHPSRPVRRRLDLTQSSHHESIHVGPVKYFNTRKAL